MKSINTSYILLGMFFLLCLYVGFNNWTVTENEIEKSIQSHGLSEDRQDNKAIAIINHTQKGICIEKTTSQPLIEIDIDGNTNMSKTKICGLIATKNRILAGDAFYLYDRLIYMNYFFVEKLKEDMPEINLKTDETLCIGVEKLSHLPEFSTKGPWFLFPKCSALVDFR